ncbi:MAG: hypothetical protein ACKV2Q_12915 [Planctomycetaceae bacterium]
MAWKYNRTLLLLGIVASWSTICSAADTIRVGAWNIEWLGVAANRTGTGKNVAQKPKELAKYLTESGVAVLALEEICDDDGDDDTMENKTLNDTFAKLNEGGVAEWKYELYPKKDADGVNQLNQHVGLAWNAKKVTKQGDAYRPPVDDFHADYNLLERGVWAVKFSAGNDKTDFVLIPLHLKSNRGGPAVTSQQRAVEAGRITAILAHIEAQFDDKDIVLLGDINALNGAEPVVEKFADSGFRDLNSADEPTYHSGAPFDRIFVKENQDEFADSELTVFREPDRTDAEHRMQLSDHFMVICDFKVTADNDKDAIDPPSPRVRGRSLPGVAQRTSKTGSSELRLLGTDDEAPPGNEFPSLATRYEGPNPDADFLLSQDYPTSYISERFPWEDVDFRTHSKAYMATVLKYCFEGNDDPKVDFVVQKNSIRKWFHAPWLHDDGELNGAGREYIHGMTRERRSRPFELHPTLQKDYAQNWAVGFYNDRGGYTLGNVWKTPDGKPNPYASTFPDHTVSFKLLFTDAPVEQVPYLKGQGEKIWSAHIYQNTKYELPRVVRPMRLLQVDVAVKDPRAGATGWVFGTFIFDGTREQKKLIENLVCVGASWDDDGDQSPLGTSPPREADANENPFLRGSVVNPELLEPAKGDAARMYHLGLGGRMNGPVDNKISSCISCHGRAAVGVPVDKDLPALSQAQLRGRLMPFFNSLATKPNDFSPTEFKRYFSTIRGASHLETDQGFTYVTTDYSQQVAVGIRNYWQSRINAQSVRSRRAKTRDDDLPRGGRGEEDLP